MNMRWLGLIGLLVELSYAEALPIFDAHLHFNNDARNRLSVDQVIGALDQAGIDKVLVSSTDDLGTQYLVEAAPDRFLPALRPYRGPGEIKTWMYDESVITYLAEQLGNRSYVALGEFHAFEQHMELSAVQGLIELARQYQLVLHIHGDQGAVSKLFSTWPEARVIWAHAGFEDPDTVMASLDKFTNLWVDLSHRPDISTWAGLAPDWERMFIAYPERFLLGSDTHNLERWENLRFYALDARDWLSVLPDSIAKKIAYENAETLFGIR